MTISTEETKELIYRLWNDTEVILLYLDNAENIVFCNNRLINIMGCSFDQIIGKNCLDLLFRNKDKSVKKDLFRVILSDSLKYNRGKTFEGLILDKDNNERFIVWNIKPVKNEHNSNEGIFLVGQDVSEAKERESSLKNVDATLQNVLAEIKEYALYLVNLDGKITYFGMGSEAMLGWEKRDILFQHVSVLHNFDSLDSLSLMLENIRNFGKYETEVELITKTRDVITVILSAYQLLDISGKLSGYIFIARDITERRKLEFQVIQAEKLSALGQLSAGMAHEINNPLFVISGRLELLKDEKLSKKIKDDLNLIGAQADRIRRLVDRILKFSRKNTPVFGPVQVNEAIELILPLLYYDNISMAKIEIKKSFDNKMPNVNGDLHQLQEVFLNLLINACQSMPEGGVVEITTTNFNNLYAQIQIKDTGVGISPKQLKDIFMPFFSTKHEGTGLGLTICHNIIKNHNGTIALESQVNKGTVFTIRLPFK